MQMDKLILAAWLCVATAEAVYDLSHIETFVKENSYLVRKKLRPLYHISAPMGWLNVPCAFIYFRGQYHVFYQYHPYNGAWGMIHWGHAVSDNLVDWAHYPPALFPKDIYDNHGCLAGSAVIHNSFLTLFYTGNVQSGNKTRQTQNMAMSSDGVIFQKYLYNPSIKYNPFGLENTQNPKVWKGHNMWYMILGAMKNEAGHVLLYTSPDLFNWKLSATLAKSSGDMGYMWENPDIIEIYGYHILLLSVHGMQSDGNRFRNLYQTGYFVGKFNYQRLILEDVEVSTTTFNELDYGHDFYAPKTAEALDGRKLLIAWLGMWESDFEDSAHGWASMLTLVRELKLSAEGRLLMTPVKEVDQLRTELLEDAWYSPGEAFYAGARAFELIVNSSSVLHDTFITFEWNHETHYTIGYSPERGHVWVDRGGTDGLRTADWLPVKHVHWRIFVDHSSIEVFCGAGEVVFSSRVYPKKHMTVWIGGDMQLHVTQYKLRRSVGFDKKVNEHLKSYVAPVPKAQ